MTQIAAVCEMLKQLLKTKNVTYKQLAQALDLSEANIKRIFSTQSFTLDRLEEICQILEISLTDLFVLTAQKEQKISQLTAEQEEELMRDHKLLLAEYSWRRHTN